MVFEVSGNHQLSQTNVKTMSQRCIELISNAACIDQIRKEVIEPVLSYYISQTPSKTLANDSVFLAWRLLRQGTMLCCLLNNFRSGLLEGFHKLELDINEATFTGNDAKDNIKMFLSVCKGDLYMTDDQLFSEASLYTDDTNTLSKAIALTETFFSRIRKIQAVNFEAKTLELRENGNLFSLDPLEEGIVPNKDLDLRLRVIREIIDTEQKYVADLDKLQSYAEELRLDEIISAESHYRIFANLDKLVDFQRRFLMQMEAKLTKSVLNDVQASYKGGIAKLFIENERGFNVYETFCPNHQCASDTIATELPNLMKKERSMEPNVVLRAFLIKPTQRLCKYPLFLRELIKQSALDAPDRGELEEAWTVVNRITAKVNEKNRKVEMKVAAEELFALMKDWKGLETKTFGELLLHDMATIMMGDNSKELEVFLFERLLIMCGKSKSMTDFLTGTSNKVRRNQLVMKGHIYVSQLMSVSKAVTNVEGTFAFKMTYRNVDIEYCTLRFNMDEKVKNWISTIQTLINQIKVREAAAAAAATPPTHHNTVQIPMPVGTTAKLVAQKERRRRSLLASCPQPTIISGGFGGASINRQLPITEEEPLRLKILYDNEIFVTPVFTDIASLDDLKAAVLNKLKVCFKVLERPFLLGPAGIDLKYIDDSKDLISILDDTDVDTALTFTPNMLTVKVFPVRDVAHLSITSNHSNGTSIESK